MPKEYLNVGGRLPFDTDIFIPADDGPDLSLLLFWILSFSKLCFREAP